VVGPTNDFAIVNATLATLAPLSARAGTAVTESDLGIIANAAVIARDGTVSIYAAETEEALAGILRPGNAGSNNAWDHVEVLCLALEQLPAPVRAAILAAAPGAGRAATHRGLRA